MSLNTDDLPSDLRELVVRHIETSHQALQHADAMLEKHASEEADAQRYIPAAVQACIEHGRFPEASRQKLAAALSTPAGAIQIAAFLADPANSNRASEGTVVGGGHSLRKAAAVDATGTTLRDVVSDRVRVIDAPNQISEADEFLVEAMRR